METLAQKIYGKPYSSNGKLVRDCKPAFKISYTKVQKKHRKQKIAEHLQSTECRQNTAQNFSCAGFPKPGMGQAC